MEMFSSCLRALLRLGLFQCHMPAGADSSELEGRAQLCASSREATLKEMTESVCNDHSGATSGRKKGGRAASSEGKTGLSSGDEHLDLLCGIHWQQCSSLGTSPLKPGLLSGQGALQSGVHQAAPESPFLGTSPFLLSLVLLQPCARSACQGASCHTCSAGCQQGRWQGEQGTGASLCTHRPCVPEEQGSHIPAPWAHSVPQPLPPMLIGTGTKVLLESAARHAQA